jgi:serine/threonine-protein kinase
MMAVTSELTGRTAKTCVPGKSLLNTAGLADGRNSTDHATRVAGRSRQRAVVPSGLAGKCLGDFEVLEEVGHGSFGIVYKARQTSLDRLVAIKMLRPEHSHNTVVLERFRAEARAVANLRHPNIVQVYQAGACAAGHYFVMEFIEGPSLETILEERRITIASAVALLIRVAEAVHSCHAQSIVHRDLKPGNIMIDRSRGPVLTDFGLAKSIAQPLSLTVDGTIMGTPAYMSPEQAGEDLVQVGRHSDVYSLGAILYTMLTGRTPYDEGSVMRTILKIRSPEMPVSVRKLQPRVPVKLERICMKCLRKRPADRYQSARTLADALRQFRGTQRPDRCGLIP